jgi:hypothetical protein
MKFDSTNQFLLFNKREKKIQNSQNKMKMKREKKNMQLLEINKK